MSVTFIEISSIFGIFGWTLIVVFVAVTNGIGDAAGSFRSVPVSFYLPYIYFIACRLSCQLPRWAIWPLGMMGTAVLFVMAYLLIAHGWIEAISVLFISILLCHGLIWWTVLAKRLNRK